MDVSIVSVNYNGQILLPGFLDSVKKIKYPKDRYEVIVVDNGSADNSIKIISTKYPWVKLIKSKENLGFGAGNNLGIANSKGDLVLLLNNDAFPDKNLLTNILNFYNIKSKKEKVGAINCKMVFVDKYLHLRIKDAVFNKIVKSSYRPINVNFQKMVHEDSKNYYEDVYIPCGMNPGDGEIILSFSKLRRKDFSIKFGNTKMNKGFVLNKGSNVQICLQVHKCKFVDLIQNAGNYYFRDGYGRDRGVITHANRQFYEEDKKQYNKPEEIPGFCGAGVLLNKSAYYKVGKFDKNFFMYYEDGDLSFGLKRAGYKIYYCPNAVVRHIHSGSSKEWSDFFVYHVERGRLLFLSKNWPILVALREIINYLIKDTLLVPLYYLYRSRDKKAWKRFKLRVGVVRSVFLIFIRNLFKKGRMTHGEYYQLL